MNFSTDVRDAVALDRNDELGSYRDEFHIADPDLIYLDGNSLGRLPRRTMQVLQQGVERGWGERLIRSWNDGWIHLPRRLGAQIAALIGAWPDEVLVCETTSINLFKLAVAALRSRPGRTEVVSDELNFPSDLYILQGAMDLLGNKHRLRLISSQDGIAIDAESLDAAIDERTALVSLTQVAFKSAYMHDIERVTRRAHDAGALVLWDLSHSAGVVPLALNAWNVDLAVGCTYKHLNGGPGSPAFLYVRRDLQEQLEQPLWGWFASQDPFAFDLEYAPAEGIDRFRVGTPPVLSLMALEPALEIVQRAGVEAIRAKSVALSEYLIHLFDAWLAQVGFELGSPRDPGRRGSHVSLQHPEAFRITRALIELPGVQVIPDFRAPDNLRLGLAPLYNSFEEVHRAMARIREIVEGRLYERFSGERSEVT